jgi:putative ABC transport system permease protein
VFHIIGITRDFNFNSLRQNVTPTLMMMMNDWAKKEEGDGGDNLCIKIRSENLIKVISSIESYWKSLSTMRSVEYSFMDDDFNAIYESEQRMGKIFVTFTSLAIIIACLGLFGLAAYAAEQRSREISIRKVLGASVSGILLLLSKNFIRLTIFSIFIATPLAYMAMQKWLQAFAYRVNVHWWDFVLAGSTALLVAFTTVCFQSLKAANANPVTSLRSE